MSSIFDWFRSWRLASWRSALVATIVLYALFGFLVVPWIVQRQIETKSLAILKRQATVERVRCNPFALSLTIDGLSLPDRAGSVLLSWDRLYVNAQASSLFRWAATLKELRIERPYVAVRRFADGQVNVVELMKEIEREQPAPEPEEEKGLPRLLLQHAEVVDGRIELEDRMRPEPLLWELGPSHLELLEISTLAGREGSNDLVMRLPGGGALKATGKVTMEPLRLDGTLVLEDNGLASSWRAVRHLFKFDLTRGVVGFAFAYQVRLAEDGYHVAVNDAELHITDFGLQWEEQDVELLKADSITMSGGRLEWPEKTVAADTLVIDGAAGFQWIEPDGTPSWDVLIPKESQQQIAETYREIEKRVRLDAFLGRFEVRNSGADFEDRTFSPPVRFSVGDAALVVSEISSTVGTTWPFKGSLRIEESAVASAEGRFGAAPLALETVVALDKLALTKYQPYLARFAPLDLRAGVLKIEGNVKGGKPRGGMPLEAAFAGSFEIAGLDLKETVTGSKLIGWGDLAVEGIDATLPPLVAKIQRVVVDRAGLEPTVAEDGSLDVLKFFNAVSKRREAVRAQAPEGGATLPSVQIAELRLKDCYGIYTDRTVPSGEYRMALKPIDGTVSGIVTDSAGAAKVGITAGVDSGGRVRVEGKLDPFNYQRLTDLAIDVRDLQLPAISPMAVKFIGYPITAGDLALDLDYEIEDRYLKARNRIDADDLELGDKVDGEGMIDLPFKLGVSLLKDREGRIVLDIPFEGSFAKPGFGMASAATAAVSEIVSELAKSPFRALGKIGGGGAEQDLEFVEFAAGSADVGEEATGTLAKLATGLAERPALVLGVSGCYDEQADADGIRERTFREELAARGVVRGGAEVVVPLDVLESMYRDRQPAQTLDALRAQHTAVPSGGTAAVLDELAYRDALLGTLIAAQTVDPRAVPALGPARAEAIRAYLTDRSGLDAARISVAPEAKAVPGSDRRVRCQLELSAK